MFILPKKIFVCKKHSEKNVKTFILRIIWYPNVSGQSFRSKLCTIWKRFQTYEELWQYKSLDQLLMPQESRLFETFTPGVSCRKTAIQSSMQDR